MNRKMKHDARVRRTARSGRFLPGWRMILLAMLALFFIMPTNSFGCKRFSVPRVSLPDAVNSHYQPARNEALTVYIGKDGTIAVGYLGNRFKDLEKFATMWEELVEETKMDEDKVFLEVDKDAQYGTVVKVLELLAKANVRTVGLITNRAATVADFTYKKLKEYKKPKRHWRYRLRY